MCKPRVPVAVCLAALALAGCGRETFKRQTLVEPAQEIPASVRRLDVLPIVVECIEPEFQNAVPTGATEDKITEHLLKTGLYDVSILRYLATDLPNYRDVMKTLVERGEVAPELGQALRQRGSPPDALLAGSIWVARGAPPVIDSIVKGLAGREAAGPSTRVAVSSRFRLIGLDGKILAMVERNETQPLGRLHSLIDRFAEAVVKGIVPHWEEQKWELFCDSDATEAAALRLKAYGVRDEPRREDLVRVKDDLERHLSGRPDDDCALFLLGMVHELAAQGPAADSAPGSAEACLRDLGAAKQYYEQAIGLRQEKGYSRALARAAALEGWVRKRAGQRQTHQADREAAEEAGSEGKDYRDLKKE